MRRINQAGPAAARLAAGHPAHFIAFDLLHLGRPLTPQSERRAVLEAFFTTTAPGPTWTVAGVEGLVFKNPRYRYEADRQGRAQVPVRATTEGITGAAGPAPRRCSSAVWIPAFALT